MPINVPSGGASASSSVLSIGSPTSLNIMLIGDSEVTQNQGDAGTAGVATTSTTLGNFGPSWTNYMAWYAGNARIVRTGGIGGQTSTQIAARFVTDILQQGIGMPLGNAVFIMAGTNDFLVDSNPTVAKSLANIEFMCDAAIKRGLFPILSTIFPRSDSQVQIIAIRAFLTALNAGIIAMGARKKVLVMDMYSRVANPDGTWINGYTSDGVHAIEAGCQVIGKYGGEVLRSQPYAQIRLGATANTIYDPMGQYSQNGLCLVSALLVTTTTAGVPDTMFDNSSGVQTKTDTVEPAASPGFTPLYPENANWFHRKVTTAAFNCTSEMFLFAAGNPIKDQGSNAYMAPGDIIECSYKLHLGTMNNCKMFGSWNAFGNNSTPASPFGVTTVSDHEYIISNWFQVPQGISGQLQLAMPLLFQSLDTVSSFSYECWATRPTCTNLTKRGEVGL